MDKPTFWKWLISSWGDLLTEVLDGVMLISGSLLCTFGLIIALKHNSLIGVIMLISGFLIGSYGAYRDIHSY